MDNGKVAANPSGPVKTSQMNVNMKKSDTAKMGNIPGFGSGPVGTNCCEKGDKVTSGSNGKGQVAGFNGGMLPGKI